MLYLNQLEHPNNPRTNTWVLWVFLLVVVIMLGVMMSSCISKEKCDRKYPPQVSNTVTIKDSIITVKDTVYLESETVMIHDSIPCPDYHHTITKGHVTATIDIKSGKLSVICKDDSLMRIINQQEHIITTSKNKVEVHNTIEYRTEWYDILARWASCIFFLLIAGFIASKIK